jgi:regulator of sigma E protease
MSIIIFLFMLGLLIVVHEAGHFMAAKKVGVRVEKFSLGFGKHLLVRKKGDTEYCLSAVPLGGYVKLAGDNLEEFKGKPDEYFSKSPGNRAKIIVSGPLVNYVMGFLCFWLIFFAGYPTLTSKVGGLLDGLGAKEAGIQVGDTITAIDGKQVSSWETLQDAIQDKKSSSSIIVSVLRDKKPLQISVKIKEKELDDILGAKQKVSLIGISPAEDIITVRHGFAESFLLGVRKTWGLTVLTYRALGRMITGRMSIKDSVTGPLGIFFITKQAAGHGIIAILHLIAVLNISLAIFNLLPFPVLDGGHIVLLALEKIRGRGISVKAEQVITNIGLTVIIMLALVVTYNDVLKFGDKIFKFFAH